MSSEPVGLFGAPPSRPIRLGVIGLGGIAASSHLPSLRLLQEKGWLFSIVDIADPNPARVDLVTSRFTPLLASDFRVYADGTRLLADNGIDAVLILTPPPVTVQILGEALNRGIPALAEKPVATYAAELDALVKASERSGGSPARVAYNRRSQPLARPFRDQVTKMRAAGSVHVEARLWREKRTDAIFYNDTMVHALDFLLWTLGELAVERVEWWPAYHSGGLAAGLRAWLRGEDHNGASVTAHLDVRPSCGRAIETYEALSEGRAVKLHYPVPGPNGCRPRLTLYENSQTLDLGASILSDPFENLIAPGFCPQIAAFLRLAADGRDDSLCTLADARRTLAVKQEVLADYERVG